MLIFFMTEIFYRPANVSGVKTPPYIALLQPEFPGKMTANPKKLATVRRVFNTAHSMPYAFLYSHAAKRLPKEVASHGKIHKTAGRSGQDLTYIHLYPQHIVETYGYSQTCHI